MVAGRQEEHYKEFDTFVILCPVYLDDIVFELDFSDFPLISKLLGMKDSNQA